MTSTQSTQFEDGSSDQPRTDKRGRVWVSRERREQLLDEFEKSRLSAAQFCRLAGVHYATFANWRQKRRQARRATPGEEAGERQQGEPGSSKPIRLLEACVEGDALSPGAAAALVIDLPGNARLRVESPFQLRLAAELVALLAQTARL